jgi:GNAT superfamily N-acetyltransferase
VTNKLDKPFWISSDKSKLDMEVIHGYLTKSYWAKGITKEKVQILVNNSLCFGLYDESKQIGFGRVLTDYAILAYLADVFVLDEYRSRGLGKMLVEHILSYPELKAVKGWMLATRDAHSLYEKYGFNTHPRPERLMVCKKKK